MANTYTLIASNTLGSTAASVTFSSIPNTYTDLVLKVSARNDAATVTPLLAIRINNNTSSLHSSTYIYGNGTAVASDRESSKDNFFAVQDGANATSNTFGNVEVYLPNYLSSSNKVAGIGFCSENNATSAWVGASAGLFRNTATITRIDILNSSTAQFVSGSSFWLYGIKNS